LEACAHARIGTRRRHQGRYLAAAEALQTAVTLFKHCPSAPLAATHNEIGFTHLGRGQYAAVWQDNLANVLLKLGDEETAVAQLQTLLDGVDTTARQAALHYELWRLGADGGHAAVALALYQELVAQTADYEYRQRLAELETAVAAFADAS
jgi:tetratricopeptide (TPR) repeat protein